MRIVTPCLLLAVLLLVAAPVAAHTPSDSFLTLEQTGSTIEGRWDIAVRDLDYAVGVDGDGDGVLTWGELRARHDAIAGYALARLDLRAGGDPCVTQAGEQLVDHHGGAAYTVLRFRAECPRSGRVELGYRLFFDLDPTHRGMLSFAGSGGVETAILGPDAALLALGRGGWSQFAEYLREGVWHIWIGFDHILFLLTLLLPAVLLRDGRRWRPASSLASVLGGVAGIVTAFTVAHSITLSLAVLGWVTAPSRWVETAIAATVVAAALNNLRPVVHRRLWLIAFALGLVHGFGFAGVLAELGLPAGAMVRALVGFNLGVEIGQLAIVAVFLPVAYLLRGTWAYRRLVFTGGSAAVAVIAAAWLVERGFAVELVPW